MLKSGDTKKYVEHIGRLQHEAKQIVKSIISLVYFMRGAISYQEMMRMTVGERELVSSFIEERFEQEKKNPHPVY
jgi:uncharacterized protein (UPF0335 family)